MNPIPRGAKVARWADRFFSTEEIAATASSKLIALLLLVVCLSLNIYLRLFPAYFPQLKTDAVLKVVSQQFQNASREA